MVGTSARLLQLLGLLQRRAIWSGEELARRLEVDVRTVRRDVDKLRTLGYRIHSTAGAGGGYQLGAGESVPPLLLSDEEAVTVAVALLSASITGAAGVEQSAIGTLAKLDQVLPPRLRRRVQALSKATDNLPYPTKDAISPAVLLEVAMAVHQRESVILEYQDRSGKCTRRAVDPYRLVAAGNVWYLPAWDGSRADWRTFRVDRIKSVKRTGRRFTPRRMPKSATQFVAESVTSGPYRFEAQIRIPLPAKRVEERLPPRTGRVVPDGENACILYAGGNGIEGMAVYLLWLDTDFEVLEPAAMREAYGPLAERCRRIAAKAPHTD